MEPSIACSVSASGNCAVQYEGSACYNMTDTRHTPYSHEIGHNDVLPSIYRPHGTLARTLYYKYLADERLQRLDKNQWYKCDAAALPDEVRTRFLSLGVDQETEVFLDLSVHKSDSIFTQLWHSVAKSVLGWFMTQTSINGLLGRGSMFVYSLAQFRRLLAVDAAWRGDALLDIGAGDGKTTEVMASCFKDVYATEISGPMRWILTKRGFRLLEVETWTQARVKFDVITCLNLLDRCDRPLSLLKDLREALAPGGRVIVALVLPFNPYVEIGRLDHQPTEWLPIRGTTYEQQAASVITDVFEKSGFYVERWSRVPYLCEGDMNQSFYWLDDAVFVLRVDHGQTSDNVGQTSGNVGQTSDNPGQTSDNCGEMLVDLGQASDNLGQMSENRGETLVDLGQASDDLGQTSVELGETSCDPGEMLVDLGQASDDLGPTSDNLGQMSACKGQTTVRKGQKLVDHEPMLVDHQQTLVDHQQTQAGHLEPLVHHQKTIVDHQHTQEDHHQLVDHQQTLVDHQQTQS